MGHVSQRQRPSAPGNSHGLGEFGAAAGHGWRERILYWDVKHMQLRGGRSGRCCCACLPRARPGRRPACFGPGQCTRCGAQHKVYSCIAQSQLLGCLSRAVPEIRVLLWTAGTLRGHVAAVNLGWGFPCRPTTSGQLANLLYIFSG